jgi:lysophospholipid acyltransferase (LPLAT)-like uncharacterized protein
LSASQAPPSGTDARAALRAERRREWQMRWIVRLGVPLVRLLGWTWRIRVINGEASVERMRRERRPIVFALWHGDMLPLLYQHRGEGAAVLISEHRDGELIARVAKALGFRTVRGSTTRGASRALVGLTRELMDGHDIAVTPDGPRGPARSFAPGALIAAQRARAPVLAVGLAAKRAWRLTSWDRFVIPKPFSRVCIAYSDPVLLDVANPRAAAQETSRFQQLMLEVERLADA